MLRALEIARADPDRQIDLAAAHGGEAVGVGHQIAGNQREQVTRLGPRVVPLGPVCAVLALARAHAVAVAQQHRERVLRPGHAHAVSREHVGPVGEEGDAAEALGLALGAEHPIRGIEAHQLGVGRRGDLGGHLDQVRVARQRDHEVAVVEAPRVDRLPVDFDLDRNQAVALEPDHRAGRSLGVALHCQRRADLRPLHAEREVERDFGHQPGKRGVILAADQGRCLGFGRGVGHLGIAVGVEGVRAMSMRRGS